MKVQFVAYLLQSPEEFPKTR